MTQRELSPAEKERLKKFQNKRGRRNPAKIPARLARTSAFAPKKTRLNTDSTFSRFYVVPGQSVIKVTGRELGTQHRDAIYAVFRLPHKIETIPNEDYKTSKKGLPYKNIYKTITTWRQLLRAMGKTEHTNNLMTLTETFEAIAQVVFTLYEDVNHTALLEAIRTKDSAALSGSQGQGGLRGILGDVDWDGLTLDSQVSIEYSDWSANMIASAKLVRLNADVHFKLNSDYAKTFWPYIDSMNNHFYVDESVLAALAGRDLWGDAEDKQTRGQFRRESKAAFNDMVRAGGLKEWRQEETGSGRKKSRRYYYTLATIMKQLEMPV